MRKKVLNMDPCVGRAVSCSWSDCSCTRSAGQGCAVATPVSCDPRSQSNGSKTVNLACEFCEYQPEAVQLDTQHVLINTKLQTFDKVNTFEL